MYVNCSLFLSACVFKMAVEFLHKLNVPFFKVGSGDTNNFPYLKKTAQKGPIFIFKCIIIILLILSQKNQYNIVT